MPQSLRSILGKSNRVRKPSRPTPPRQSTSSPSPRKARKPKDGAAATAADDDKDYFEDRLEDAGMAKLLVEDLTLRDVVQAMRYIRSRMFSPMPQTGLHSSRSTDLLSHRAAFPPLVTAGHLAAVLHSPTRVDRELADLLARGVVRKVRVDRRGAMGEALIEAADLEQLLASAGLADETRRRFGDFLREHPTAQTLPAGALTERQADELIRAGLLTSSTAATAAGGSLRARPEDRTTLTSIERVSRHASGTEQAVGGRGAVHLAGGGSGPGAAAAAEEDAGPGLRVAVPGHGRYLRLAEGAVGWVREALGRTRWGEGTEGWLRERFEGGGLYGTRWKEFAGVRWEWVIGEAAGLGVVELFQTGSVGRGVRALA